MFLESEAVFVIVRIPPNDPDFVGNIRKLYEENAKGVSKNRTVEMQKNTQYPRTQIPKTTDEFKV